MNTVVRHVVKTQSGRVQGLAEGSVVSFRGIPFASPPVGGLRWRPAEREASWDGTLVADRFAPAPLQAQPKRRTVMYETNFVEPRALVMSEDCLYMNIWTADPSKIGLPVFVWVPGGGNRFGWASQSMYHGGRLASLGMVVVTISYRLGPLGFLAHPALSKESSQSVSGNYALTDMIRALQWVQENIEGFGGDPSRVTVVGNSAGAAHVCHLMAAPLARGLFSQAIGQSGSGFASLRRPGITLFEAEKSGEEFAEKLGARTADELRDLSGADLIFGGSVGAITDGSLLPAPTQDVFRRGEQSTIPLLVGTNADESSPYTTPITAEDFRGAAPSRAGDPGALLELYPARDDVEARVSSRRYQSDLGWHLPAWKWAVTHARSSGQSVYVYRFDHSPPLPAAVIPPRDGLDGFGAYHTAELLYMWDNLDCRTWDWTEEDRSLAKLMSDAWARFVSTGNPSGGSIGTWPTVTSLADGPAIGLGREIAPARGLGAEILAVIDEPTTVAASSG